MAPVVPPQVPAITRDQALGFLAEAGLASVDRAVLLGRRGFFVDMGEPGNDYGIFDDGIALVSPAGIFTFNANTDPSIKKPKVAVLQPGRWTYKIGTHNRSKPVDKQYRALIQSGEVTVFRPDTSDAAAGARDNDLGVHLGNGLWRGDWFGVNIHRGGANTTGSEGCQTIYKPQWESFLTLTEMEMKRYGQASIEYFLTEEPT